MSATPADARPTDLATIEAANLLLGRMGIRPADLLANLPRQAPAPLIADYILRVSEAVSNGTRRVYSSYWKRVTTAWGSRRLTEVTALDISRLAEQARADAVRRANSTGGRGAAEHMLAALRCVYKYAVADGIIRPSDNPAARVTKPRRLPSTRRALPDDRLGEICRVAARTGNDPALDALLLRLHIETACRRGGALALTTQDLDAEQSLIRLHEKGGTIAGSPSRRH
jgi:integrase/recombinase XerC